MCEEQYGFMPGKSTTDAIFALGILLEKYRGQKELHWVFVDFRESILQRTQRRAVVLFEKFRYLYYICKDVAGHVYVSLTAVEYDWNEKRVLCQNWLALVISIKLFPVKAER